jgi:hypothetical protein
MIPEATHEVANNRTVVAWALVAFGAQTSRPTIVCIPEDALPAVPGPDWLVFARDRDIAPRLLPPSRSAETNASE